MFLMEMPGIDPGTSRVLSALYHELHPHVSKVFAKTSHFQHLLIALLFPTTAMWR